MIGRLSGKIVEREPGRVLLDVGGVGYAVQIPLNTFYTLRRTGSETTLCMSIPTCGRRAWSCSASPPAMSGASFELLIGISGVGPKLALAILSGIGADELQSAVAQQDRPRLQSIPGVGRKTAERLLLELRDKLRVAARGLPPTARSRPAGSGATEADGQRTDAVSALVNLGYTRDRAARAVDTALEAVGRVRRAGEPAEERTGPAGALRQQSGGTSRRTTLSEDRIIGADAVRRGTGLREQAAAAQHLRSSSASRGVKANLSVFIQAALQRCRTARPRSALRPAGSGKDHAGARDRPRDGRADPGHLGPVDRAGRRPGRDPDQPPRRRGPVHGRDPPPGPGPGGDPLPRDGGPGAGPGDRQRARAHGRCGWTCPGSR